MNNNFYPVPEIDQIDWGAPLQLHLRQLIDPTKGGINIFEGNIPNTSLLKEGYTYIDTSTRALKRWTGTEMEILLGGIAVLEITPEVGDYNGQIIYNTTEQAILQWVPNPDPTEETGLGHWQYLVGGTNSGLDDPEIWGFEPPLANNYFFKLEPSSNWVNSAIPAGKLFRWTGFEWEQLLTNVPFGTALTSQAGAAYLPITEADNNKLFSVISTDNKATIYQWVDSSSSWVSLNNISILADLYPFNGNILAGTTLREPTRLLQEGYKFYNTTDQNLKVVKDGVWDVLLQGVNSSTLQDIEDTIDEVKDELEQTVAVLRAELETLISQLVKPGDLIVSASGASRPGYLVCNGAEYPIATYGPLYNAIPRSWDNHPTLGLPAAGNFRVPDASNRSIIGFSGTRPLGTYGGAETVSLTAGQNGAHAHGVSDPGHNHAISDGGHSHGVSDPGHGHSLWVWQGTGSNEINDAIGGRDCSISGEAQGPHGYSVTNGVGNVLVGGAGSNISIAGSGANIGINGAGSGITIQNSGSGTPHENMSPYSTATVLIKT